MFYHCFVLFNLKGLVEQQTKIDNSSIQIFLTQDAKPENELISNVYSDDQGLSYNPIF
jgi:hypothetical protein